MRIIAEQAKEIESLNAKLNNLAARLIH